MAIPSLVEDLEFALRLADATAPIAMGHYERGVAASAKTDGSPVTEADHEVERMILDALAAERPTDAILSEESGGTGRSTRRWIVDPIDGTASFVAHRPTWATMVALEVDDEVRLGVIDCPAMGVRLWATRGNGAFADRTESGSRTGPRRLAIPSVGGLASARLVANARTVELRTPAFVSLEQLCSAPDGPTLLTFDLLFGGVDVVLLQDHGDAWDHAPYVVLVEEAGGAFFDLAGGRRLDTRSCVYTAASLELPVRSALGV